MACAWWVDHRNVVSALTLQARISENVAAQARSNASALIQILETSGYQITESVSGGLIIYPPPD
jgi:hypothetical protein